MTRRGQVLLVRVQNLSGERVWTFPKGHLDPGETPRHAALREVQEETGYDCQILKPLLLVSYAFKREGRPIHKTVQWFWMRAGVKSGEKDAGEIEVVKWMTFSKAKTLLKYPSDFKLLEAIEGLVKNGKKEAAG